MFKLKKRIILFLLCMLVVCKPVLSNENVTSEFINDQTSVLDQVNENPPKLDLNLQDLEYMKLARNIKSADAIEGEKLHYSDVKDNNWAYQALSELTEKYGVLKGMPDGAFEGDRPATRYEMAQALVKTVHKLEEERIKLSAIEEVALKSLKKEFDKEIIALAARIEKNEQRITGLDEIHKADIETLTGDIENLKKRHYFVPTLRFMYGFGDFDERDGTHASTRLRLTSVTKVNKDTVGVIRLQAVTSNFINMSEVNGDIVDMDLALGYVQTGSLTRWLPEKYGKADFFGGVMPANWYFWLGRYTTCVDERPFNDSNFTFSLLNTQVSAFGRDAVNGRRMVAGGQYIKKFDKYNAKIQAVGTRATAGSLPIAGTDNFSSGDETTFYAVSGEMDLPIKHPVNFKVSHFYSFGDAATNERTYSVGGRLTTKFENFGVLKGAVIGHNGTVPPRYLGGRGGQGFSYQVAYNPTIKAFGNLFGNPDEITHHIPNHVDGKTEVGVGFANYHNDDGEAIRALDVYIGRFFTTNIFGRVIYSHVNPSVINRVL
ncbi:MAG: S-layer homology domain-containing protein, partial [Cyanobacteriota bacterium]